MSMCMYIQYIDTENGTNENRQLSFVCCKRKMEDFFPWSANYNRCMLLQQTCPSMPIPQNPHQI